MTRAPEVTIVIPCYNSREFIAEAITSALRQTHSGCEVVVVDDGSTDDSREIINSFNGSIVSAFIPNSGACEARNQGLVLAKGEYIKFLDADDLLEPDAIAQQIESLKSRPKNCVVFGDWSVFSDGGDIRVMNRSHLLQLQAEDPVVVVLTSPIMTSCPLYRREQLLLVGGFSSELVKGQEHDLHLRLALAGNVFQYVPGLIYRQRTGHSDSRISSRYSVYRDPQANINSLSRTGRLIQERYPSGIPEAIAVALAQRWWRLGRDLVKARHYSHAEVCFSNARTCPGTLSTISNASKAYVMLAHIAGPRNAEHILQSAKRLAGRN